MKILILEDEPLIAQGIVSLLKKLEPAAELSGPFASVRETKSWLENNKEPDLVLADIQLSDGISFIALETLPKHVPVIFTTAFDEYALRAFRLNSVDYLLKPIDEAELKPALMKFHLLQEKYKDAGFTDQMQKLMQGLNTGQKFKLRFLVYSGKSVVPVNSEQVCYFIKEEIIFLTDRSEKQYVTEYRSLDELQEIIDPAIFFRANRQFIVHADCISKFETDYLGKINLHLSVKNHPEITVSKDKAAEFKRWMDGR